MSFLTDIFNNRELAWIFWTVAFLAVALSWRPVRRSALGVVRILYTPKILMVVLAMLLYVSAIVLCLRAVHFWTTVLLKDTIYWIFGVAFVIVVNIEKAQNDEKFFEKTVVDSCKLFIVLEFLVNFYVFPLWIEFVVCPVLALLVLMKAVAETDPRHEQVEKYLEGLLGVYGLAALVLSFVHAIRDLPAFLTPANLRGLLLAPIMTVAFLPFVYLLALFVRYEALFARIEIFNGRSRIARYAKRRLLLRFCLNLRALNQWSRSVGSMKVTTETDVRKLLGIEKPGA